MAICDKIKKGKAFDLRMKKQAFVTMITPFAADGSVDYDTIRK